jgi:hypothetical protein
MCIAEDLTNVSVFFIFYKVVQETQFDPESEKGDPVWAKGFTNSPVSVKIAW